MRRRFCDDFTNTIKTQTRINLSCVPLIIELLPCNAEHLRAYESVNDPLPGCSWWKPHQYSASKLAKKPAKPASKVKLDYLIQEECVYNQRKNDIAPNTCVSGALGRGFPKRS